MPVPSLVTDLSATIASNSPAGSDNVFPDLDGYLRSLSGFLASIRDNSGNGWVSPYLPLAGGTVTGPATFSSTVALNGALSGTGLTTYLASPPAIGGTAAAAVSSTNLAYTGTLTGGTGVVALGTNQFYKDASGNVGIGTASPGQKLTVAGGSALLDNAQYYYGKNAAGSAVRLLGINSGNVNYVGAIDSGPTEVNYGAATTITTQYWNIGAAEQMRLTSTGLGIGTASPSYKLDVSVGTNTIAQQWQGAGTNFTLRLKSGTGSTQSSSVYRLYMDYLSGTNTNGYIDFYRGTGGDDGYLVFGTNGLDRMTLNAAGNLGLGVTPSAWDSGYKAMQVGSAALFSNATGSGGYLLGNAYFGSGGYKYYNTAAATRYEMVSGAHTWSTASSGTAGAAISFTQAMTLDASGNLVVGNTTANERLEIYKSVAYNSDPALYFRIGSIDTTVNNNTPYTWRTGITGSATGYNYVFQTLARAESSWVERARITSGGNLLVGTTTDWGRLTVTAAASGWAANFTDATAGTQGFTRFLYGSTAIGSITGNNTATAYNTTSDQRLKTNIVDAPDASALIDSIKVRSYDWIADNSHQRYGMVAQELFEVAPEAVHAPADPDEMMAVDYSKLVPMLIKEIQSLRARVASLENQP